MAQNVCIRLAGRVSIEVDGTRTDLGTLGHLGQLALAYLVMERRRPVSRPELAEVLWGDEWPQTWPASLRGVLARVRTALSAAGIPGASALITAHGSYELTLPPETVIDVEAAAAALSFARDALHRHDGTGAVVAARHAVLGLAEPFLPGPTGHWVERRRAALMELRLEALQALSQAAIVMGDLPVALEAAEDAVALQPLRESAHLCVMAAHAGAGNRGAALRAYERCRRTLAEELGVNPSATTEEAYLSLLTDDPVVGDVASAKGPNRRLPVGVTSFVGRTEELTNVRRGVDSSRLLSLVGPGGVGKSRLALEAARELAPRYPDGGCLVELAGVRDPSLVPQHVLSQLGLSEQAACPPLESLVRHLASTRLLLVLDNCEHVIEACAGLAAELLRSCPGVQLMTTSRQPLGVAGERIWPVPPLATPVPGNGQGPSDLMKYEAVSLFVQRAEVTAAGFLLDDRTAPAVALICHRLDGIPLAIELAAARTNILSVFEIAGHLDDRFGVLVGGPRTAPARHQTLRAAMDWSYEALSADESSLFCQLSVFAGGFTLAGAQAICGENGSDVLAVLSALVDKSLVVVDRSRDESRYGLLETIREYGASRLTELGQAVSVEARHLAWASELAEAAEGGLNGAEQERWLQILDGDYANLRAALDRAARPQIRAAVRHAQEAGARIAVALCRYWAIRGLLTEGRSRVAAWTDAEGIPVALRARLLNTAGVLAELQGDHPSARRSYEESMAIRRQLPDDLAVATTLHGLANLAIVAGDLDEARCRLDENLRIARSLGERQMVAASLMNLGVIEQVLLMRKNIVEAGPRAREYYAESLEQYRHLGDRHGMALALHNLGTLAPFMGDDQAAVALHEESLAIRRELGDKPGIATSTRYLRKLLVRGGDRTTARELSEECLRIERELDSKSGQVDALRFLGGVAIVESRFDEAGELFDQAVAIQRQLGDTRLLSGLLIAVGSAARRRGDFEVARCALEEAIEVAGTAGHRPGTTWAKATLASVEGAQGNHWKAASLCAGALEDPVGRQDPELICVLAETLAGVAVNASDWTNAARLFGAADMLRPSPSMGKVSAVESGHPQETARAMTELGADRFATAWDEGAALRLEDAAALLDEVASGADP